MVQQTIPKLTGLKEDTVTKEDPKKALRFEPFLNPFDPVKNKIDKLYHSLRT
jgi:hypothetical protein